MLRMLLAVLLAAAWAVGHGAAAATPALAGPLCDGAKHPIVILPGIMASQINGSYNGVAPGAPCIGRKKMHQIWPPSAKDILPTGFACWKYLIQLEYDGRAKAFGNNRGVKVQVESGGKSGTRYHLFQASYANLTDYLVRTMGYTVGKDLFGAPYDWRLHISGLEQSGQMDVLAARVENAVNNNCGKRAILIGHSMGGLVATALTQRDPEWSREYVKGLVTVSSPFGGTTDQAITVRLGAVEWDIHEWVKNPIAKIAKDLTAHAQDMAKSLEADELDAVAAASIAAARRVRASAVRRVSHLAGALSSHSHHEHHHSHRRASGYYEDAAVLPEAGQVSAASLPKPINNMVKNYISAAFFKVTMGLPGLAMLLPYPSAYGAWRRIVVTRKRTYTASMMKRLMGDIGDSVTSHAWPKVQELDKVLAGGAVPGVATYCMYGHLLDTTLTWSFPNVQENKAALTATPLVTTSGDGTVSVQSLKQCYRLTSNITELGAYGHLEVLKHKATLAQLREVIREIAGNPDSTADGTHQHPSPATRLPQWPSADDQLGDKPDSSSRSGSSGGGVDGGEQGDEEEQEQEQEAPMPGSEGQEDQAPSIEGGDSSSSSGGGEEEGEDDSYESDPWELEVDTQPAKPPPPAFSHLRNDKGLPGLHNSGSSGGHLISTGAPGAADSSSSSSSKGSGHLELQDPGQLKHAPFTKSLPTISMPPPADSSSSSKDSTAAAGDAAGDTVDGSSDDGAAESAHSRLDEAVEGDLSGRGKGETGIPSESSSSSRTKAGGSDKQQQAPAAPSKQQQQQQPSTTAAPSHISDSTAVGVPSVVHPTPSQQEQQQQQKAQEKQESPAAAPSAGDSSKGAMSSPATGKLRSNAQDGESPPAQPSFPNQQQRHQEEQQHKAAAAPAPVTHSHQVTSKAQQQQQQQQHQHQHQQQQQQQQQKPLTSQAPASTHPEAPVAGKPTTSEPAHDQQQQQPAAAPVRRPNKDMGPEVTSNTPQPASNRQQQQQPPAARVRPNKEMKLETFSSPADVAVVLDTPQQPQQHQPAAAAATPGTMLEEKQQPTPKMKPQQSTQAAAAAAAAAAVKPQLLHVPALTEAEQQQQQQKEEQEEADLAGLVSPQSVTGEQEQEEAEVQEVGEEEEEDEEWVVQDDTAAGSGRRRWRRSAAAAAHKVAAAATKVLADTVVPALTASVAAAGAAHITDQQQQQQWDGQGEGGEDEAAAAAQQAEADAAAADAAQLAATAAAAAAAAAALKVRAVASKVLGGDHRVVGVSSLKARVQSRLADALRAQQDGLSALTAPVAVAMVATNSRQPAAEAAAAPAAAALAAAAATHSKVPKVHSAVRSSSSLAGIAEAVRATHEQAAAAGRTLKSAESFEPVWRPKTDTSSSSSSSAGKSGEHDRQVFEPVWRPESRSSGSSSSSTSSSDSSSGSGSGSSGDDTVSSRSQSRGAGTSRTDEGDSSRSRSRSTTSSGSSSDDGSISPSRRQHSSSRSSSSSSRSDTASVDTRAIRPSRRQSIRSSIAGPRRGPERVTGSSSSISGNASTASSRSHASSDNKVDVSHSHISITGSSSSSTATSDSDDHRSSRSSTVDAEREPADTTRSDSSSSSSRDSSDSSDSTQRSPVGVSSMGALGGATALFELMERHISSSINGADADRQSSVNARPQRHGQQLDVLQQQQDQDQEQQQRHRQQQARKQPLPRPQEEEQEEEEDQQEQQQEQQEQQQQEQRQQPRVSHRRASITAKARAAPAPSASSADSSSSSSSASSKKGSSVSSTPLPPEARGLFAEGEALPAKALVLPKPVSVLPPGSNPLSQLTLVGPPRSVALGTAWAHEVYDVASGVCLMALANGQKPPPGCI